MLLSSQLHQYLDTTPMIALKLPLLDQTGVSREGHVPPRLNPELHHSLCSLGRAMRLQGCSRPFGVQKNVLEQQVRTRGARCHDAQDVVRQTLFSSLPPKCDPSTTSPPQLPTSTHPMGLLARAIYCLLLPAAPSLNLASAANMAFFPQLCHGSGTVTLLKPWG